MIGRETADRALVHEIRAAVAEVGHDGLALGDRGRDQRRGRSLLTARARSGQHRVVRFAHRRGQRIRARELRGCCEEPRGERLDRGRTRGLAAGLAADAVRDGEQRRAAVLANDVAILVLVPRAANVAARGGASRQD